VSSFCTAATKIRPADLHFSSSLDVLVRVSRDEELEDEKNRRCLKSVPSRDASENKRLKLNLVDIRSMLEAARSCDEFAHS
jgi:hypothetical protein